MNNSELGRKPDDVSEFASQRKATRLPKSPDQGTIFRTYNEIAKRFFEERINPLSHFEEFVWPAFTKVLGDIHGKTVVDMGCGPGVVTKKLADGGASRIWGLDLSQTMLTIARDYDGNESCHPHYIQGNTLHLPFESKSADLIVASYVLNHIGQQDLKSTLREGRRVLNEAGRFLIIDPHPDRCQLYYQANGGRKAKYPRGWYMEGWPELDKKKIPVYYRHEEDWVNAFQASGFREMRMYAPTSNNVHLPGLSMDMRNHYAEHRILIIELVK